MSEIIIANVTDESREQLGELALEIYLKGKKCKKCGFKWKSREDVMKRAPIEGWERGEVWCKPCWDKYGRLAKPIA